MTIDELSELHCLNCEIEKDKERLEELKQRSYSVSVDNTKRIPGKKRYVAGSTTDRFIADIIELEERIYKKMRRSVQKQIKIERYISNIPDSLTRLIFTERFINGMSWAKIARSVGGHNTEDSVKKICYRYINTSV